MKEGQTIGQWLKWDFKANWILKIKGENNKLIYLESSGGFWAKWEYDSQGTEIYYESSNGTIKNNRPPEIIEHNGNKYQLIR